MNILLNIQSFHNDFLYDEIVEMSKEANLSIIYICSSLMNDLRAEVIEKYNSIDKVQYIDSNSLFSTNYFKNELLTVPKAFISKQDSIYSNLLASFRWMPLSKRTINDVSTFTMTFHYDTYNFWNLFFQKNKIDSLISLQAEHSSLDTILINAAKDNGIKNILTTLISGWQASITEEYFTLYDNINGIAICLDKYTEDKASTQVYDYKNKQNHSKAYQVSRWEKINIHIESIKYLFKSKGENWKKIKLLMAKAYALFIDNIKLRFQLRYISKLKKYYENVSIKEINTTKKYIYYCLHFDPEATTLPKDTIYSNQLLNIRIIASSLPDGWKLYVKEHPHQLNKHLYKNIFLNQLHAIDIFRSIAFYNYINTLNNVKLVSLEMNHNELIKNAEYIASSTGTVFREATQLRKRCITFSSKSIYLFLNNVYKIQDYAECSKLFQSNPKPIYEDVDELFDRYTIVVNDLKKRDSILLNFIIINRLYRINDD